MKFLLIFIFSIFLYGGNLVYVSIMPQKYFADRLVKGIPISVKCVLPQKGYSYKTYKPRFSQIRKFAHAKVFFTTGLPYEKYWIEKIKERKYKVEIISTISKDDLINIPNSNKKNLFIWLDPILVNKQVKIMYESLIRLFPRYKNIITFNYQDIQLDLKEIYINLRELFDKSENSKFMVLDYKWDYFALRFNLKEIIIKLNNKIPSANDLIYIMNVSRKNNVKLLFLDNTFPKKTIKIISEYINGQVYIVDPFNYNWNQSLLDVANKIIGEMNE